MPTSHLITGSRNSALVMSGSLLLSNLVTIALCSALAGLASLTFLHLGSELKAKTVGTASCFSIYLNGSNSTKVYEKENVLTKWSLQTRTLHSYICDLPAVASTATRGVGGDDSNGHLTQFSSNSYLL